MTAVAPTAAVAVASFLFIPRVAVWLAAAGAALALLIAAVSHDRLGAFVGGIMVGVPSAVVAFIAFVRECNRGGNFCN